MKIKNKIKICFITSPSNIFFNRFCEYLISRKHEIHIIPLSIPDKKINDAIYHDLGSLGKVKIFQILFYLKVRKYVKRMIQPDILSSFSIWNCGWIGAFSNYHPFILHILGSDLFINPKKSFIRRKLTDFAIKRADVIISEALQIKEISSNIRGNKKNNYIVQFGVKLDMFKPNLDVSKLKEKFGIQNEHVIISPRNNGKVYNQDIVIESFSIVCKKRKNDVYLLMKKQNEKFQEKFEELALKYDISGRIKYYGFVPLKVLPYYYNLADICVSVPSSDSIPVSLQEAMACGVVPVVSDLPSVREIIKENLNGLIVPVRNAEKLAEKINYLLDNEEKRDTFIKRNLKFVKKCSDFDNSMAQMEKIYKSYQNQLLNT